MSELRTILEELVADYPVNPSVRLADGTMSKVTKTNEDLINETIAKIEGMIRDERADAIKSYKKILKLEKKAKANLGGKK